MDNEQAVIICGVLEVALNHNGVACDFSQQPAEKNVIDNNYVETITKIMYIAPLLLYTAAIHEIIIVHVRSVI